MNMSNPKDRINAMTNILDGLINLNVYDELFGVSIKIRKLLLKLLVYKQTEAIE